MERFLIKVAANGVVVVPMLMWFTEAGFWAATVTSGILSGIAYLLGDQLVLRASNNAVATLADAVLAFVYLWAVADFLDWNLTWGELLMTTAAVGIVEVFFHRYLGYKDKDKAAA